MKGQTFFYYGKDLKRGQESCWNPVLSMIGIKRKGHLSQRKKGLDAAIKVMGIQVGWLRSGFKSKAEKEQKNHRLSND
jgi:hypothetical protein